MKSKALFIFLLVILSHNLNALFAQCNRPADSLALVALYNSTNGPNWTNTWDLSQPIDSWYGVTLNGNGCVQRIWMNNNNLDGPLPSEFGNLTNLQEFRAGDNQLSGNLPSSFYSMPNISTFWVSDNNLSGVLPPEVGQLTQIRVFNLGRNNFSGTLPAEIGDLTQITHFYFSDNNFDGSIPPEIINLNQMTFFQLDGNELTGEIPAGLADINSLAFIRLQGNNLTGSIPLEFSSMSNLEDLNVRNNQLSGYIPDFYTNNLPLDNFRIQNNQFTFEDLIPNHQANADLVSQNIEYPWDDYEFSPQLSLNGDTSIYRVLGENITIDLGIDENVADNEYRWFKNGALITTIIGDNRLAINNLSSSDFGVYDCKITNPNVTGLQLESGFISLEEVTCRQRDSMVLVDLYNATNGPDWTNAWDLNSSIGTWYGVTLDANGCLFELDLDGDLSCNVCAGSGNNLVGSLPNSISRLTGLFRLSLGQNEQLVGEIPDGLGNLNLLSALRLDANLSGAIPQSLTNLSSLSYLNLSSNNLTGLVPDFSTNNLVLDFLSVSDNQLIFSDLTPHIANIETLTNGNFLYTPQAKISEDEMISEDVGYDLKLDLPGNYNPDNIYRWFKDGVFLTAAIDELTLEELAISDMGDYHCEVTNANAPDLTLSSGIFSVNIVRPNCKERDSLALVAFYKATGGPNWTNTWDTLQPVSTWYGVTLDANGCVGSLDLDGNLDSGCPHCSSTGNNLVGSLPEIFYDLDRLRGIYFTNNIQLGGQLPASINKLDKLEAIYSNGCNFSGELPQEIGDLTNLIQLNFNYNNFSGTLPSTLNNLSKLKYLNFWNSDFTGEIPNLSNLTMLEDLGLSYNEFTGQIPSSLAALTSLESLALIGNQLSGEIPSFLPELINLRFLYLGENQFYGNIPGNLSELPLLEVIDISSNNLTGIIPPELSNNNTYDYFEFSNNKLQGTIPESFDTLKINRLFIQDNQLVGDVSTRLAALSNIEAAFLDNNLFSGEIPDLSTKNPNLSLFTFTGNDFTFSDILPNLTANINLITGNGEDIDNYRYYPQNKIYKDTSIMKDIGDNLTIDLIVDEGLALNVYTWFKNGNFISTINGDNDFTLSNLQYLDGGIYQCQVTNTNAPNLTLQSHPIQLTVNNPNCRLQDSLALVALYNATNGANWTNTWDLNQSINTWYGVTLDDNGCVQGLDLDGYNEYTCRGCSGGGNNLTGSLPIQIGNLSALTELSLSENSLNGTMPSQIGNLLNLKGLYLADCGMTGAIPSTLNNLFKLDRLYLYDNQFSGAIPDLSNLSQLERIYCYENRLDGTIPYWLTSLTKLKDIRFSSNQLMGSIPNGFENLTKLENLDFRYNQLTGNLPSNLDQLNNLYIFWFDGNNIEGEIPSELASLSGNIGLSNNNLSGDLPSEFANHQNSALHIDNNELEGDLSTILAGMESMFRLKLENNNFTGVIPDLSVKSPSLVGFYIQNNLFTFEHILPNHLVNKNLTITNAEYEAGYSISPQQKVYKDSIFTKAPTDNLIIDLIIDDTVTSNVYNWYKDGQLLTTINGDNELILNDLQNEDAGIYYCEIFNPNIPELILYSHNITLNIFDAVCHQNDSLALVALYNATDGANWTNTWDLTQPMDTWYGVILNSNGCVEKLDLDGFIDTNCSPCTGGGNNLNGTLPTEIWALGHLNSLSFGGSEPNLTVHISSAIQNLTNLEILSFSFTNFSGQIPTELGMLSNLKILRLDGLGLTGTIPSTINNLINLENLVLFSNQLTSLPDLGNLTNLKQLYVSYNQLSGNIPFWISNLINLESLILESNQFMGTIPSWIPSLSKLGLLNLSRNNLSGIIPTDIGMLDLYSLTLSHNELEGTIPSSIGNMDELWNLRLDNNNLTGTIPVSLMNYGHGYLKFENNKLTGLVPNFALNSTGLIRLNITDNEFTFDDILAHIVDIEYVVNENSSQATDDYFYTSQAQIYKDTTITKAPGDNLTIDLIIDDTVTTNIYKWYKDGQLITIINGNNEFTINDLEESDEGVYYVEVSNPNAPDLTLISHNITIEITLSDCYFDFEDLYNPIIPHTYNVQTTLESSGTVETGTVVKFIAGTSITLKDGFHAEAGSDFLAKISDGSPCNGLVPQTVPATERNLPHNIPAITNLNVFPNPFRNQTTIAFNIPKNQRIHLGLYSLTGQIVSEVVSLTIMEAGAYQYELSASGVEEGLYIVILKTEDTIISQKVVLSR